MLPEVYLKKSFYEVENKAEQHYRLLNTLKLIDHNSYLYCFCKKYISPEEQFGSALCSLCRNLFFNNYTEFFDRNQFNPCKLGFYFSQLFDLAQMFQWKIEKNLVFPTIENLKKIRDHQIKDTYLKCKFSGSTTRKPIGFFLITMLSSNDLFNISIHKECFASNTSFNSSPLNLDVIKTFELSSKKSHQFLYLSSQNLPVQF